MGGCTDFLALLAGRVLLAVLGAHRRRNALRHP